jgi:hypothetical protein
MVNIEEAMSYRLSGYPSLAAFIASDRDRTTLVYKRFDELAARNLLYLQSELVELQAQQRAFDQEDLTADLATKQCSRTYSTLTKAVANDDQKQQQRWDLILKIRQAMKDYREALMFESTLATMLPPSKKILHAFQDEFYNQHDGKSQPFPTLGGNSAGIYDDRDDLVALRVVDDLDRLTTFAQEHLAFFFPVSWHNRLMLNVAVRATRSANDGLTMGRIASAPNPASPTLRTEPLAPS